MSTIIAVENVRLLGRHGVFDYEREEEQPFVVSVWVRLEQPASGDDLETSVDYGFLQRTIYGVIADGPSMMMMETLCDRIIEPISGHLNVAAVKVRIEKPDAPMPHASGLALVERIWPEGTTF